MKGWLFANVSNKEKFGTKPTKPSYTQAPKVNINTFKKENSASHNENKPNKNINERSWSLSHANRRPKEEIIWSTKNWKTNLSSNYKYQQEINQFQEEIKLLKQTKNNH